MSGMDRLTFNEWFTSLEKGRQAVLRDDKWMLADAAFQAGRASQDAPDPVAWRYPYRGSWEYSNSSVRPNRYEAEPLYAAPAPSDGLREAVDAAWNDAIEAAEKAALDRQGRRVMGDGHSNSCYDIGVSDAASAIRALRRAASTEGGA